VLLILLLLLILANKDGVLYGDYATDAMLYGVIVPVTIIFWYCSTWGVEMCMLAMCILVMSLLFTQLPQGIITVVYNLTKLIAYIAQNFVAGNFCISVTNCYFVKYICNCL